MRDKFLIEDKINNFILFEECDWKLYKMYEDSRRRRTFETFVTINTFQLFFTKYFDINQFYDFGFF